MMDNTILVIGGHIRSGTTLLRNLCNSHPEIAITNEFNYFSGLDKTFTENKRSILERLWGKTASGQALHNHFRNYVFVARYLYNLRRYKDGHIINLPAIEKALRGTFPEIRIVGDKTPSYVFLLDNFVQTNGLSNLIIFRDCRDVVSSTLQRVRTKWRTKRWTENVDTAAKVAARWVRSIEIMERNRKQVHIVRYEDLVRRPNREVERLAKMLGVDPLGFSGYVVSNIRDSSIGKFRTGLTKGEIETVVKIAGPTMAKLGYI